MKPHWVYDPSIVGGQQVTLEEFLKNPLLLKCKSIEILDRCGTKRRVNLLQIQCLWKHVRVVYVRYPNKRYYRFFPTQSEPSWD